MKRLKRLLITILVLLFLLIVVINIPIIEIGDSSTTSNDYSNWMSETISDDKSLTTIKMLGAHDAFSKDINLFSQPDVSADSIMTGFSGFLVKGFIVKQSVTQTATATQLLNSGVRYLDIRLTLDDDSWVTKHNYVSSIFDPIANEITTFLEDNPGELLILDFQHIHGIDYANETDYDLFIHLLTQTDLLDYSFITTEGLLQDITYGEVTNKGTESKVIIIDKFSIPNKETYSYEETIRSNWANSDDFDEVVEFLEEEASNVKAKPFDGFVVMQSVTTMSMSPRGIINTLKTWSLIERAEDFNMFLLSQDNFSEISNTLPIIMVDYSHHAPFVDDVMEIIIKDNQ